MKGKVDIVLLHSTLWGRNLVHNLSFTEEEEALLPRGLPSMRHVRVCSCSGPVIKKRGCSRGRTGEGGRGRGEKGKGWGNMGKREVY